MTYICIFSKRLFVMSSEKQTNVTIADRLANLVNDLAGGNAKKFAEDAGIGSVTFYNYLKGRLPGADALTNICEFYRVNINWLLTGVGRRIIASDEEASTASEFSYIPLVEAHLSGGDGSFVVSEEVKEYCAFRTAWLNKKVGPPKGKYLMGVVGDSMAPTIQNGDTVMINTDAIRIFDGNIYALRMDSTILIKRLGLLPGNIVRIISDNKTEYDPVDVDRDDVHVLGRVVWFARTLVKSD